LRAIAILGPDTSAVELAAFAAAGWPIEPLSPATSLADADAVLVFGGDGTIHRHLAALSAAKKPVLMVPRGSGNDFARALGITSRAQAFAAWNRFCTLGKNVREIDLGSIRSSAKSAEPILYCCVAGAGLDSEANRHANAMPRWLRAHGGYLLGALWAVAGSKSAHFTLESDTPIRESGLMAAFANAPAYGDGIRIAPRAQLDDGLLDVCFVRAVGRARLLRLLPTVFSGRHVCLREVEYFQTSRLRIETTSPLAIYADGEYVCHTPAEIAVVPHALRVIVAEGG
jgi:diacylglycerol kinase (ATP)